MIDLMSEISNAESSKLFLLILGSSGAGKSHAAGTAPGKILHLYTSQERHGPSAAAKSAKSIVPVCIDRDKDGKPLSADDAFKRTIACLNPEALKKAGITSVVLDGLTELEKLVRLNTRFINACATKGGGHNSFAEPAETVKLLDEVMNALRTAQDLAGVHVIALGILDVQEAESNGAISLAKPRSTGYTVAESIIQQFGDILVIGKVSKADGSSGHVFQTATDVTRVSTDEKKNVKRFINFSPRLMGAKGPLPQFIKADLAEVIKLKGGDAK